jgi:hypothetical protein
MEAIWTTIKNFVIDHWHVGIVFFVAGWVASKLL